MRFRTAAFSVFVCALTACGGGGGSSSGGTVLPAVGGVTTPVNVSGPVTYMQSSGPLATSGTIVKGTSSALVAVISGVAQPPSAFTADTLTVASNAPATQSVARADESAHAYVKPLYAHPAEAFAADDSALLARLHATLVPGAAPSAPRSRSALMSAAAVGAQTNVWVQQGGYNSRTNVQVPATLIAQTAHGNIWAQNTLVSALTPNAAQLGAEFENAYTSDTAHFASPDYPSNAPALQPQYTTCSPSGSHQGTAPAYIAQPGDKRIDVMIVDSPTLGGLGGYFSAANLMTQGALNCLNAGYESNQAPFIFVGWFSNYGTAYELQEDYVRSTAHELQHLINFVNHGILAAGASSTSFNGNEAQYVNEGLSMLAQDFAVAQLYGSRGVQFDSADALARAQAYLADPSAYSISAFSGIDPGVWGGNGSTAQYNCSGGCYGGAYLFMRYLRDRYGENFTHAMETSGVTGAANLQGVTGENAGQLFGDFALAMAANTLGVNGADPRFAFGSLSLKATYPDQLGTSTTLRGVSSTPLSGSGTTVRAPIGGFAFVAVPAVPASGASVQVTDGATVSGFSLLGGLAQH